MLFGVEKNNEIEILEGVKPGEEIVTSAQFLFDSESRLQEAIQKMLQQKQCKYMTTSCKKLIKTKWICQQNLHKMNTDHTNPPTNNHNKTMTKPIKYATSKHIKLLKIRCIINAKPLKGYSKNHANA